MSRDGRWVGRWWEYACPRCSTVSQATHPPDDAHCSACRLVLSMASATLSLSDLIADRDEWRKRALEAEQQNGALLDELHDARRAS